MNFITYVKEAVTPGGTPARYLVWVQIILLGQVLTSVVPSPVLYETGFGLPEWILVITGIILLVTSIPANDHRKILLAYALYL